MRTVFACLLGGFALVGCQKPTDRLGGPGQCDPAVQLCTDYEPGGVIGTGPGGDGGAGGGATEGTLIDSLNGTLAQFVDTKLDTITLFPDTATVVAPGKNGVKVIADAADGSFTLEAVVSGPAWILVSPTDTSSAVSTYTYQDVEETSPLTAVVLPTSILEDIAAQAETNLGSQVAHFVLTAVDSAGDPVEGIAVVDTSLPTATIAYELSAGQFTSTLSETGASGRFAVLNVPVSGAGEIVFAFTKNGGPSGSAAFQTAPNAVTITPFIAQ